ncbi:MAG: hypothetical protein IJI68_00900 [Eggerthellaceae bacterium]|nr:hypothetical protein [Kiritimatiellia bacterium]MBR0403770.1 hypothetical protein [Eggerthellaceae bacterium]
MAEMYTSPERVERGGWLVAFEGEVMTMDEAVKRGLVSREPEPEEPKGGEKRKADWVKEAEALGIEVPKKATVEQIKALIEDAGE